MKDNLSKAIKDWVGQSQGWFSYWQLDEAVGLYSPKEKTLRRVIMKRLVDKDILVRAPLRDAVFRRKTEIP